MLSKKEEKKKRRKLEKLRLRQEAKGKKEKALVSVDKSVAKIEEAAKNMKDQYSIIQDGEFLDYVRLMDGEHCLPDRPQTKAERRILDILANHDTAMAKEQLVDHGRWVMKAFRNKGLTANKGLAIMEYMIVFFKYSIGINLDESLNLEEIVIGEDKDDEYLAGVARDLSYFFKTRDITPEQSMECITKYMDEVAPENPNQEQREGSIISHKI